LVIGYLTLRGIATSCTGGLTQKALICLGSYVHQHRSIEKN
jgi:hypothetical protein